MPDIDPAMSTECLEAIDPPRLDGLRPGRFSSTQAVITVGGRLPSVFQCWIGDALAEQRL
jgi:hypothetical protein